MNFFKVIKEVLDINLYKRSMENALSTVKSEMDNVQTDMAEKDKKAKEKEEENARLKQQIQDMTAKLKTTIKPVSPTAREAPGTSKQIGKQVSSRI